MKHAPKGAARALGTGLSVAEWIAVHPDRYVTRRDMGLLFALFENARKRSRWGWLRRVWAWLHTPVLSSDPADAVAKHVVSDTTTRRDP